MDFLRLLAEYRTPMGNFVFQSITYIAQELFVIAVICWLFWCSNKSLAYKLGFSYFLSGLAIQGLKITFRIPRPWILDFSFEPVKSAVPGATGYSFPSGHTQSGTAFFTTLAFQCRRTGLRLLCIFAFFLIGFSRMYLGVHTPKDVFVSMAVTFLLSSLVYILWKNLDSNRNLDFVISLVLSVLTIVLVFYDLFLVKSGVLTINNAMDCCKACGAGLAFAIGFYLERRYLNFTAPATSKAKFFRFLIGLLVTAVIELGLKALLPETMPCAYFRYFVIVFWILVIYPFLFTKAGRM